MDFALSAEQEQLRDTARRFLQDDFAQPPAAGRDQEADWSAMTALGWFDPELGMVERVLIAEECGYALASGPYAYGLALPAALRAESVLRRGVLLEGSVERVGEVPDGLLVSGEAYDVHDATAATGFLVTTDAVTALIVDRADPGCVVRQDPADPLGRSATVSLTRAAGRPVEPPFRELEIRMEAVLAAECVGVARHAYDVATAHAKTREQFGRPIGAYQGIAFGIADSYVRAELARSLVLRAAWLVEAGAPDRDLAVSSAVPAARAAAVANCEQAIQTLGGTGMTSEHPLHYWYRRALWLERRNRATRVHLDEVAHAVLDR